MRVAKWFRRHVLRGDDAPPERVGLLDVARALLSDSDDEAERVAAALAQQRERKAREVTA